MDLINYYNTNILGYYPGDNQSEKTMCTISYLRDCGFKDNDILKIINEVIPQEAFTPDMLPERLWDGSLLMIQKRMSYATVTLVKQNRRHQHLLKI